LFTYSLQAMKIYLHLAMLFTQYVLII